MNRPNSITEWSQYIQGLTGHTLYSQAVAANTHTFARALVEEGATMAEVEQVLLLFVRQLRATGVKIPEGGPFDLVTMGLVDGQARKGITHSQEELVLLESQAEPHIGGDDLDGFELAAGFEG